MINQGGHLLATYRSLSSSSSSFTSFKPFAIGTHHSYLSILNNATPSNLIKATHLCTNSRSSWNITQNSQKFANLASRLSSPLNNLRSSSSNSASFSSSLVSNSLSPTSIQPSSSSPLENIPKPTYPSDSSSTSTTLSSSELKKTQAPSLAPDGFPLRMAAWRLNSQSRVPNGISDLHLETGLLRPPVTRPDHILVRIKAASLNPIDLMMLSGYGHVAFDLARDYMPLITSCASLSGPATARSTTAYDLGEATSPNLLVPGRDASGVVVAVGPLVSLQQTRCKIPYSSTFNNELAYKPGDRVALATWPFLSQANGGCLADFVVCSAHQAALIPDGLSDIDAAAVAYSGLTAWSALEDYGGFIPPFSTSWRISNFWDPATKVCPRTLIAGASGGVGLMALQLAKMWGARVTVTVPSDARAKQLVEELGADEVIIYPDAPPVSEKYNLIVDCTRGTSSLSLNQDDKLSFFSSPPPYQFIDYLSTGSNSRYIDLNSPLLRSLDRWGLPFGLAYSLFHLSMTNLRHLYSVQCNQGISIPGSVRWAFFRPSSKRLSQLLRWTADGQLRMPIEATYPFNKVPEAFAKLQARKVRGKLVVVNEDLPNKQACQVVPGMK